MSFLSLQFWIILPLILLYSLLPDGKQAIRKLFLLTVSVALYVSWNPISIIFLAWVAAITYSGALFLEKARENEHKLKLHFWGLLILTLLPLVTLKIRPAACPSSSVFFPVGLSFFTLQAVGYLSDVYHGRTQTERNILDYSLFICFFPQLSSGPISKANELLPQLANPKRPEASDIGIGIKYLIWGIFLKAVVADNVGASVDAIYKNYLYYSGADCLLATILYCFQLYADFCGYTLIALGLARICGICLIDNFRQPYQATSISDFWRRWHISLSRWLKDYIYIPLGGSRCSRSRNYMNLLITFIVSGLWHGVEWTFVLWGVFLGFACILEKALKLNQPVTPTFHLLRQLLTFCAIDFSFILFRSPSISFFKDYIRHIIFDFQSLSLPDIGKGAIFTWIIGIGILITRDLYLEYGVERWKIKPVLSTIVSALLICGILSFGVLSGGNFIYVNF